MKEKELNIKKVEELQNKEPNQAMSFSKQRTIAIIFCLLPIILIYLVVSGWIPPETVINGEYVAVKWLGGKYPLVMAYNTYLIIMVALLGALGSCIHSLTSFVWFKGRRKLEQSYFLWYLLRPFIGSSLALIAYFVIRGGLIPITVNNNPSDINTLNVYGILGLTSLVGMFSRQAAEMLNKAFDVIFAKPKTAEEEEKEEAIIEKEVEKSAK